MICKVNVLFLPSHVIYNFENCLALNYRMYYHTPELILREEDTVYIDVPAMKGRKWYSLTKDLLAFVTGRRYTLFHSSI